MRAFIAALVCSVGLGYAVPSQGRGLDLKTSIEAAHFVREPEAESGHGIAVFSPDGRQFVVRLVRADIERDGAWLEVYVGKTDEQVPSLRRISRLFTRGLERPPVFRKLLQDENRLVWLDDRRFAFLWEDSKGTAQVVAIHASDGRLAYLTRQSRDVTSFQVSTHGILTFLTQRPIAPMKSDDPYGGTLITASDVHALLSPTPSLGFFADRFWLDAYIERGGRAIRLPFDFARRLDLRPAVAPSGDRLVVNVMAKQIPAAWQRYRQSVPALPAGFLAELERRSDLRRPITQAMIVETSSGAVRPLWDRPTLDYEAKLSWSPSGNEVLVPAALPAAEAIGTLGTALFATVDIGSGAELRVEDGACGLRLGDDRPDFDWLSNTLIRGKSKERQVDLRRTPAGWSCETAASPPADSPRGLNIFLRQSRDRSPVLVSARDGKEHLLLDPAPELSEITLGRVELFEAVNAPRSSRGWLYYPVNFVERQRYPLVVQLTWTGEAGDEFSLYGAPGGTGVGAADTVYAAQLLSARDIMVLSLPRAPRASGPEGAEANRLMIEAAIGELDRRGLIDRARVGIAGHSLPGWFVAHCLTHSSTVFAAALLSDTTEAGYLMWNTIQGYGETEVGAAPFGEGLKSWLERAQAFNVARIRTPLRIHNESSPGVGRLNKWELFSRMRLLGLPVEYFDIPDVEHGAHLVNNPRQAIFNKAGAVDWFSFWLKDEIDPTPIKAGQYRRWAVLRQQHQEVLKKPHPPLLKWTATPIADPVTNP